MLHHHSHHVDLPTCNNFQLLVHWPQNLNKLAQKVRNPKRAEIIEPFGGLRHHHHHHHHHQPLVPPCLRQWAPRASKMEHMWNYNAVALHKTWWVQPTKQRGILILPGDEDNYIIGIRYWLTTVLAKYPLEITLRGMTWVSLPKKYPVTKHCSNRTRRVPDKSSGGCCSSSSVPSSSTCCSVSASNHTTGLPYVKENEGGTYFWHFPLFWLVWQQSLFFLFWDQFCQ